MRQKLTVSVSELVGTNYDIGVELGKSRQDDMQFHFLRDLTSNMDVHEAKSMMKKYSFSLLDEIKGVAIGLNIDFDTAIRMYSGYNLTFPSMGCTAYADSFYVRNYDFSPALYDARIVFAKPTSGYASVGFSQQVVGRLDGMNEHGLVVGLHLVNEKNTQKGFIGTTIVRLVLDQCRNVEEARKFLSEIPHSHCYNYSLLDREGNKCVMEASPKEQIVMTAAKLMCANHFEAASLKTHNRENSNGSRQRKGHLQHILYQLNTPEKAYQLFNDEKSPLFFTHYKQYFGTLHTVVYIPETLEIMVGIGGDAEPVRYSFKEWLEGKALERQTIIGSIEN